MLVTMVGEFKRLGLDKAGYLYLNLDDGWETDNRDENGRLVADPTRMPNGIPWLADFIHNNSLKFGIY